MEEYTLPVSEQFRSIQGEGKTMGVPAYFLRLKSCNMLCGGKGTEKDGLLHNGATWRCDSIEVWLKGKKKTFNQIIDDFGPGFKINTQSRSHHVVLTGGEPLLHEKTITEYMDHVSFVHGGNTFYEIETNGSIHPQSIKFIGQISQWNISPKLSNSGVPLSKRLNPDAIIFFSYVENAQFKFVISNRADFMEVVRTYLMPYNIPPKKVWLMPAADNEHDLQRVSQEVAEICMEEGFNFSSRLHVAIWNKKTGV